MDKFDNLGDTLANIDWSSKQLKSFKKDFYKVSQLLSFDKLCSRNTLM